MSSNKKTSSRLLQNNGHHVRTASNVTPSCHTSYSMIYAHNHVPSRLFQPPHKWDYLTLYTVVSPPVPTGNPPPNEQAPNKKNRVSFDATPPFRPILAPRLIRPSLPLGIKSTSRKHCGRAASHASQNVVIGMVFSPSPLQSDPTNSSSNLTSRYVPTHLA